MAQPLTIIARIRGVNETGPWMLENGAWWHDADHMQRLFSWLTRNGMAPKFGTTSIHDYQNGACKALDRIAELVRAKCPPADEYHVRVHHGLVQARMSCLDPWKTLAKTTEIC